MVTETPVHFPRQASTRLSVITRVLALPGKLYRGCLVLYYTAGTSLFFRAQVFGWEVFVIATVLQFPPSIWVKILHHTAGASVG